MTSYKWFIPALLFCLVVIIKESTSVKFQNDISGTPVIECNPEAIVLKLNTTIAPASKIFVRGFHDDKNCSFENENEVRFNLHGCGTIRHRQLQPKGLAVTTTVVVQLHPLFITKLDKAYKVRCFYMETDHMITSNLEVSTIAATPIEETSPLPICNYYLKMGSPDGEPVSYAKVGDQVWHVWECESEKYGLLVHSCTVQDGKGNNITIIDEHGCALDDFIMETPSYNVNLTQALQETTVFKFADVLAVQFHCQIKLCFKSDGGCERITPPLCGANAMGKPMTFTKESLNMTFLDSKMNNLVEEKNYTENNTSKSEQMKFDENFIHAVDAVLPNKTSADGAFHNIKDSTYMSDEENSTTAVVQLNNDSLPDDGSGENSFDLMDNEKLLMEILNDSRSRRNVYGEPWFTESPSYSKPLNLETDVSQEMLVLEVGDAKTYAKGETGNIISQVEMSKSGQQEQHVSAQRICLSTGETAAMVSAFVFVIMLLSFTIFILIILKKHATSRAYLHYPSYKF
ncbi:Cuticlin-1 [Trichinella sp. T9]|nr:Cuticlin-1 [Trichinella sp. T9]